MAEEKKQGSGGDIYAPANPRGNVRVPYPTPPIKPRPATVHKPKPNRPAKPK